MAKLSISPWLAILFTLLLAIAHPSQGQDHDHLTDNDIKLFLEAHNKARAGVGVSPIKWDAELAAYAAKRVAEDTGVKPPDVEGNTGMRPLEDASEAGWNKGKYGENTANGYAGDTITAVSVWVSEKDNYDYSSNSCAEGKHCESYTQMVWHDSKKIGCGFGVNAGGWPISICEYDPPGNVPGKRPY